MRNFVALFFLLSLLSIGVYSRAKQEPTHGHYQHEAITHSIARSMEERHGLTAKIVRYTNDGGVRGLQLAIPECKGNLQILPMDTGDEYVGLWEGRARAASYETRYIYKNRLLESFPQFEYWTDQMLGNLARRMLNQTQAQATMVIATAYPAKCGVAPLLIEGTVTRAEQQIAKQTAVDFP